MKKSMIIISVVAAVVIVAVLVWINKKQVNREFNPIVPSITDQTSTQSPAQSTASGSQARATTPKENFSLEIASQKLSAPIVFDVDGNNQETYLKALENGVAHLAKSTYPGATGNTVIFGHSSYYNNLPGNYKTIFAKLDKVGVGETISLKSNSKTYNYSVTEKKVVKAEDVSVVAQDKSQSLLTLITCWPVGTTNSRYVVVAKLTP